MLPRPSLMQKPRFQVETMMGNPAVSTQVAVETEEEERYSLKTLFLGLLLGFWPREFVSK